MKTNAELLKDLADLEHVFGFNPAEVDQTSDKWHLLRLGCYTASKAECLIKKKHGSKGHEYGIDFLPATDKDSKRNTYMLELVSEIATARLPEDISAKPLQWGRDNEAAAREAYEAATFTTFTEIPFIYKDQHMRAGISPDGLNDDSVGGLELKCPWSSKVFVDFLANEEIKPEYRHQCQFSMWVTGRQYWDFANFDPRMVNVKKLHYVRIDRCTEAMAVFDEAFSGFVIDMDKMLQRIGAEYGDQWNPELHNFQQ
jgi:hypothetical protein